jgi:hypothetical protein
MAGRDMTKPVRLQLSRAKGFQLQGCSRAANGLAAVNVARPSKYGNVFRIGLIACSCRSAGECSHNAFRRETAQDAVDDFRSIQRSAKALRQIREDLGGKNLACWCAPGQPCHADVLLELANP